MKGLEIVKDRFENTLGYLIFEIIVFFGLPTVMLVFKLRAIYNFVPIVDLCVALAVGFTFGRRHGGDWLMSIVSAIAFIPCVYIFYNSTAWIYVFVILLFSLLGVFIGAVFRNRGR